MLSPKNLLRAFAISVGFVFAMPFLAYAEPVYISNETLFIDNSSTGVEMVMTEDITLSQNLVIRADSSIDLNGHTLILGNTVIAPFATLTILDSSEAQSGVIVNTGSFTVQVGSSSRHGALILESGTIDATDAAWGAIRNYGEVTMNGGVIKTSVYGVYAQENSVFTMNGGLIDVVDAQGIGILLSKPGSKFIMNGGKIQGLLSYVNSRGEADGVAGVAAFKDTEVIINGGEINTFSSALMGNGSGAESGNDGRNVKFTVNGGTLSSAYAAAIYAPQQQGETVITGGTLKGITGIEVRAGNLTISGGEFISIHDTYSATNYTNGMATWGAAVSIQQHTTKQPINVTITGGTFTAPVPLSFTNALDFGDDILSLVTIDIQGGTFDAGQGAPIESVLPLQFVSGGIYSQSVNGFVVDGYGEVPLENGMIEVTPLHTITVNGDNTNSITVDDAVVPYKGAVRYTVVDDPDLKEVVEIVDENGDAVRVRGGEFVMPDSNVTIRVSYVPFTRYTATLRVVNGTWSDGGTDDITIEVFEGEDERVVLLASALPTGMIAANGFDEGAWDVIFGEGFELSGDAVFTFAFEEMISVPDTGVEANAAADTEETSAVAVVRNEMLVYGAAVFATIIVFSFALARTKNEISAFLK